MVEQKKKIGILTSGGDAPGMNAAIRAVVNACYYYGMEPIGIRRGYRGLLDGDMFKMDRDLVADINTRGGTILQTVRCHTFRSDEGIDKGAKMAQVFGLSAIVVIGGDGSFAGAQRLSKRGIPVIGIPGTIDNDIGCTDYTIGFDTALNTVRDALDKIKDTASSHERCSVVEVMGRNAGYIALTSAVADGAEVCLLPENGEYSMEKDVIKKIIDSRNNGKSHFIIIVAEGVGGSIEIAKAVSDVTGIETTTTILGHIQRGGSPTVRDRMLAALMGVKAVQCIKDGEFNKIIVAKGTDCIAVDIDEALAEKKTLNDDLKIANEVLNS